MAKHAKSRMSNMQEQGHGKSVPEYARQYNILMRNVMAEILLILYTSRYHIYKTIAILTVTSPICH